MCQSRCAALQLRAAPFAFREVGPALAGIRRDCMKLFGNQGRLGVLALTLVLVVGMLPVAGCSGATVAQDIVNWTPALDSAASTIATIDPALLPEAAAFIAVSQAVDTQAKAYLLNPTASVLAQLQTAIVTAQQQVNSALLTAARVVDTATQKHVLAVLQTYGTIVVALLGLVQSISSKAAVARMAADSPLKLAQVAPYSDRELAARIVALHYGEPLLTARIQVARAQWSLAQTGF
jgi:hypothetical protein